jgi:hypothetical protein
MADYSRLTDEQLQQALGIAQAEGKRGAMREFQAEIARREADRQRSAQRAVVAEDMARGGAAGAMSSVADMGGLASEGARGLQNLATAATSKLTGMEPPQRRVPTSPFGMMPGASFWKQAMSQMTGGASDYQAKTVPGQYAQTVGRYAAPAATAPGNTISNLLRYGLAPGMAEEAAGQATKDVTWMGLPVEPAARLAAGVGATMAPVAASKLWTPNPADPKLAQHVKTLRAAGVDTMTAGQATGKRSLMAKEAAALDDVRATQLDQLRQFTGAVMGKVQGKPGGYTGMTGEAVEAINGQFSRAFEAFAKGMKVPLDGTLRRNLLKAVGNAERSIPQGAPLPALLDSIKTMSMRPNTGMEVSPYRAPRMPPASKSQPFGTASPSYMKGETLRKLYSELGTWMRSNDVGKVQTAKDARKAIEDALDRAAQATGNNQMISQYRDLRSRYELWDAVKSAAARKQGDITTYDVLTPAALRSEIGKKGRDRFLMGDVLGADLAESGAAVLTQLPSSGTSERLRGALQPAPLVAAGMGLTGSLATGQDPATTAGVVTGALAAGAIPAAVQAGRMHPLVQRYLGNQGWAERPPIKHPGLMGVVDANISEGEPYAAPQ